MHYGLVCFGWYGRLRYYIHSLVGISWHKWYAKVWHGKGRVGVAAQVGAMPGAPVGARHSAMGGLATV